MLDFFNINIGVKVTESELNDIKSNNVEKVESEVLDQENGEVIRVITSNNDHKVHLGDKDEALKYFDDTVELC